MQQNILRVYYHLKRRWHQWQSPEAQALRQLKRSIGRLPRYQPGRVMIWGWDLMFVDAASCISAFDHIVVRKWNDFGCHNPSPRILDCGANIGISVLHFKRMFPGAQITAFEPDPQICDVLRRNLRVNGAQDVQVIEAALWNMEGEMAFESDGADSGRLVDNIGQKKLVKTQRLCRYLNEHVDLVKMDIEGAEGRVLSDNDGALTDVSRLIIEYHSIVKCPGNLSEVLSVLERNAFRYQIDSDGVWRSLAYPGSPMSNWLEYYLMIYASRVDLHE